VVDFSGLLLLEKQDLEVKLNETMEKI